jgi:dTDP-4-dehydrorhamnose 3,5-epimerase
MRFENLGIDGAALVAIERHPDSRGFFARTFCIDEFAAAGLATQAVQASVSYNEHAGTVRGMHFQWPPSREGKLVRCIRGGLRDVLLDLRPSSPTYLRHVAVTLDEDNRDAVYIPPGIAHGFQTLLPRTEVLYQMTDRFAPELAAGVRWNDPAFSISWAAVPQLTISERDATYPDFDRREFEAELLRRSHAAQLDKAS